jgi:hypothetical protein
MAESDAFRQLLPDGAELISSALGSQRPTNERGAVMFLRIDRLQIELPAPTKDDPNAAAALQELLGGKFGEMSTLNNYFFQSFNFRNKGKLKPFYSLAGC